LSIVKNVVTKCGKALVVDQKQIATTKLWAYFLRV